MWLTRLALRNPILILMLSLMTVVLGLQSFGRLPVDLFPDITITNAIFEQNRVAPEGGPFVGPALQLGG